MNDATQRSTGAEKVNAIKTLFVIRHAKSSWDITNLNDFERPLNERGKKDAPMMAKRLVDKKVAIDVFISSPAKRAKKTASLFGAAYGKTEEDIIFRTMLYQAPAEVFYELVEQIEDQFNNVAIFSHNPGITEFVNSLVDSVKIDNMPTCGVFAIQAHTDKWKDFKKSKKEFLFFDYPKLL